MAQLAADRRDVDFVLHEQFGIEQLSEHECFADFNAKTIDMIVSEARQLAIKELLPLMGEGDLEGCTFHDGQVKVPGSFHRAYDLFRKGGWIAMCEDTAWGGQGMPATVALAADNYFNAANYPFMLHNILAQGAGKLIERFGTELQKKLFLKNLYSGQWGGSMLLTEPDAGSDVGALTTKALPNGDGTYSITGNKIFISSGETDLVPNIIHPVLARIEGAPPGTAGISLFLVPKIWVNHDGSLGEPNDIICTGIEEKMGIHASPTCSMALGSRDICRGTLLGEENRGMRAMFVMMNRARLHVGMQGFSCASASYLNALAYARRRIQGKSPEASTDADPRVPIIEHPDVRRMLLTMKSFTEGMRSLLFYTGFMEDMARVAGSHGEKALYQGRIDILIPVAKGYVTDRAFEMCSLGVQILGGYGFTRDFPQEQLLRDCKITQIFEGTNGIQAMDLLGRKLGRDQGPFEELLQEAQKTVARAREVSALKGIARALEGNILKLKAVAGHLRKKLQSGDIPWAFAQAHPFLEVTGDTLTAWMLLWRALTAVQKLESASGKKDISFYEGQLRSAGFFMGSVLPVSLGRMEAILLDDRSVADMSDDLFGGR
ncbi:MAG: acyl-CoA dehydrogenase [Desulfamplus sp.]|nr:acyl-CoA dehydrogenase [Desulfamplus sp.]